MNERKMKKEQRFIILLLVLNLLISGCVIGYLAVQHYGRVQGEQAGSSLLDNQMSTGEKYILYIGLNDKDTNEQVVSMEEAKDMANAVCAKYAGVYTVCGANGGWMDETNTLIQENTLVYTFFDASEEQVIQIMDILLKEFNQSSILVEKQEAVYTYYS